MGFDIYGRAPPSEAGRHFGANWGAWGDIARLCLRVAPGPCSQIDEKHWFCNDGFDPDDAGAIALADALDHAVNTDALRYEDALSGQQAARRFSPRPSVTASARRSWPIPQLLHRVCAQRLPCGRTGVSRGGRPCLDHHDTPGAERSNNMHADGIHRGVQ